MPADEIELQPVSKMDRIKNLFKAQPSYEPIRDDREDTAESEDGSNDGEEEIPFVWIEYSIFVLLGVAMLWAW